MQILLIEYQDKWQLARLNQDQYDLIGLPVYSLPELVAGMMKYSFEEGRLCQINEFRAMLNIQN